MPKPTLRISQTQAFLQASQGEICFILTRSSRKKRSMTISIDERGIVKVSSPFSMPEEQIFSFVRSKSAWIMKQRQRFLAKQDHFKNKKFEQGGEFLFLGQKYKLDIFSEERKTTGVHFNGHRWGIELSSNELEERKAENIKEAMIGWYRAQAQEILGGRVFHYARLMGVEPKKITVRTQKRLWGSCDYSKQSINLNWQIILSPLKVIDYVVVHELCHLFVPNHSQRFWKKVERFYPEFKESRKWLKDNYLDMILP